MPFFSLLSVRGLILNILNTFSIIDPKYSSVSSIYHLHGQLKNDMYYANQTVLQEFHKNCGFIRPAQQTFKIGLHILKMHAFIS